MDSTQLTTALNSVSVSKHPGYPPTGAQAPYVVLRPMITTPVELALTGDAIAWDGRWGAYCVGESVDASYNIAIAVMQALQGYYLNDSTLSVSMGYVGAQIEGLYETQVTIQADQGALS